MAATTTTGTNNNTQEFPSGLLPFIQGNLDLTTIPELHSKEIRVYLSCTNLDTLVERKALIEKVFPALREYCCSKYGLEFHVVDLRLGLTQELDDNDPYRKLYAVELEECQRHSAGPNFIALIGQHYGERPLPASIPAAEFRLLREALRRTKSRDTRQAVLLDFWYVLDENGAPPVYVLQHRSAIGRQHDTLHLRSSDGKKQILTWEQTKMAMRRLLQKAAIMCLQDGSLAEDDAAAYSLSDLEREGQEGVTQNMDPQNNCLMVARTIVDLENYVSYPQAAKFIEVTRETDPADPSNIKYKVDEECRTALDSFKNHTLHRWLRSGGDNQAAFEILWKFDDGVDARQHAQYVTELCTAVHDKMKALIDRLAHAHSSQGGNGSAVGAQTPVLPPLLVEVMAHWQESQRHLAGFVGRKESLNVIRQYVTSDDTKPLVITGPAGAGKTALLSKAAAEMVDWLGNNCVTVLRHLGTTHSSFDIRQVLHSICMQLGYLLGHSKSQLPNTMADLQTYFFAILDAWPGNRSLVILLDSLHMLVPQYQAHLLQWLPQTLKDNVKIVVTTLPAKHGILDKLRLEIVQDEEHILDLPPLSPTEALELLLQLLVARGRTLCPRQQEQVIQALAMCGWPLYVQMVCEDAARWRSDQHQNRNQNTGGATLLDSLPRTVATYMEHLFEHLEAEHGKLLVSRSLAYMTASMTGLSDAEMEDVLSLDDAVLNEVQASGTNLLVRRLPPHKWLRLKDQLRAFLIHRHQEGFSVYFWGHRQFVEMVRDRYLLDDSNKKEIHSVLADYYLGTWHGKPKPYQRPHTPNNNSSSLDSRNKTKCAADRFVPAQHLTHTADDGTITFNRRKYDQVPRHLFLSGRLKELNQCVLFNYEWLYNKTKALSLEHVLADFVLNPGVEATLVERALRDAQTYLEANINTLGVELTGRLLAYYQTHDNIRQLIQQADKAGLCHCAMLPNFPYYQVPGSPLKHTLSCRAPPTSFALVGEGQRLLLTKTSNDPTVQVHDLATGEHVKDIVTSVGDMHVTPSGTRLIVLDNVTDKSIKIHSAETGQFIGQLIPLNQLKMKPKEKYKMGALSVSDTHVAFIVTTDTSYLCVADVEACRFLEVQGLDGRGSVCHLTADGQYVFTNSNNHIRSYDLYTSERVCSIELEHKPIQVLTTELGTRGFIINAEENKVYVMYLRDGNIEFIYKVVVSEYLQSDQVRKLTLSRNQQLLLVSGDSNLVVYNASTERVTAHFPRPPDVPTEFKLPKSHYADIHFTAADFSPDDKFVVATIFRHVYIWNVSSNRLLTSLQAPVGIIDHLCIPSDRGQVATQQRGSDKIHVWGLGDAIGHVGMLDRLTNPIHEVKLSQDDTTAFIRCTGSDEIGVLDMRSGQLVDLLTHPDPVVSFSLTPNGKYALVATSATKAHTANKIWYMDSRKVIYEFGNAPAHSVTLQQENCLIAVEQEEPAFKAPYAIKLYTFEGEQFEECRLSYEVKYMLIEPFVTPADKYLVLLTADDYNESLALHVNPTICAISLKANMAVSTFSVRDLRDTVSMQRILSVRPYGHNSYTVIVFYTDEPDLTDDDQPDLLRGKTSQPQRPRTYVHCYGFMIFDVCSGVVCQVIEDLVAPQTKLDQLLFTHDVSLCVDPESHIFDMGNGFFLKRLEATRTMRPRRLALNGRVVLYAEESTLMAVRLSDGKILAQVNLHGTVTTLEVCHDERTLLLGCADGSLLSYVLVDPENEATAPVIAAMASRQNPLKLAAVSRATASRSWDKVELDNSTIPPYSRPPSALSLGPGSDKRLLKQLKPVPRARPQTTEAVLYANARSKACVVM